MVLDLNDPKLFLRGDVLEDPRPLYDELRRANGLVYSRCSPTASSRGC